LPSRKFSPALDPSKTAFPDYNQIMNLEYHHIEIIGYCAAFLTKVAFLPQAIQSWRTKDLSGISLGMFRYLLQELVSG